MKRRVRIKRRHGRLLVLLVSSLGVFILTALQLARGLKDASASDTLDDRRMLVQDDQKLRYLAFWNIHGLSEPLSYASQIATAMQAHLTQVRNNSALAAACTQTLIGNDAQYQVISIEFDVFDASMEILATRLRQRFPDAVIILIELWNPSQLRYQKSKTEVLDWRTWLQQQHGGSDLTLPQLVTELTASDPTKWFLPETSSRQLLEATAQKIQAQVVTLPKPSKEVWTVPETLANYLSWFKQDDSLSPLGHAALAQEIQMAYDFNTLSASRTREGTWGSGDSCQFWFSDGNYGNVMDLTQVEFGHNDQNNHKHAVEFRHERGDTLNVYNTFGTPRMLYLSYMVAAQDGVYPKTRVKLNNIPTVQIDPFHDDDDDAQQLVRTTAVGMIAPKESTAVRLDPLQHSKFHFRLVGASLIAQEMKNVPVEFSLQTESVPDESSSSFWTLW